MTSTARRWRAVNAILLHLREWDTRILTQLVSGIVSVSIKDGAGHTVTARGWEGDKGNKSKRMPQ